MTPQLLKSGVSSALLALLEPIQKEFQNSAEWQAIEKKAYPPPETKKKEKKVKDKGSRHPGGGAANTGATVPAAKGVVAQADGHVEGEEKEKVDLAGGAESALKNLDLHNGGV